VVLLVGEEGVVLLRRERDPALVKGRVYRIMEEMW
jgi:hypothetical protein